MRECERDVWVGANSWVCGSVREGVGERGPEVEEDAVEVEGGWVCAGGLAATRWSGERTSGCGCGCGGVEGHGLRDAWRKEGSGREGSLGPGGHWEQCLCLCVCVGTREDVGEGEGWMEVTVNFEGEGATPTAHNIHPASPLT